jgi:UDP-N-acetylmuramoyl-tripeptide--D-alanyl-D-alanine ligase
MQKIPANELLAGLTLAEPVSIHAVVTDSRKVEPGCVFVCFPGERVDGHDFAAGAYRDGAAYIIANHPVEGVPADRTVIVLDSARAMIRMAANYRMLFSPKMIGVTGSVGKTTTKEFCCVRRNTQDRGQPEQRHRRAQHTVPAGRCHRVCRG